MTTRLSVLSCVCLLSLAATLRAGDTWTATEQPDLAEKLTQAQPLAAVNVIEPVHSSRLDMTFFCPTDDTKKNWHVLQFYFKPQVATTAVICDLSKGTTNAVTKTKINSFHLAGSVFARGKLYMGAGSSINGYQGRLSIYDPKTGDFTIDAVPIPAEVVGESHPLKLGTDGMLYLGGSHPSKASIVAQINPDTHEVKLLGPIGPSHAPADCWTTTVAADDTHVYVASGKVPYYLVAYDKKTAKSEILCTTEKQNGYISLKQLRYGVQASVTNMEGQKPGVQRFFLMNGKAIAINEHNPPPPWNKAEPEPDDRPEISLAAANPEDDGSATIWYRLPADKPAEKKSKSKATSGEDAPVAPKASDDEVVPDALDDDAMKAQGWKSLTYKIPLYAQPIYRLTELADGRLFGTAGAYSGMFLFDPRTEKAEHPGVIHLSHYANIVHDGKVYMSGYPTSPLFVYDPSKPWTTNKRLGGTKMVSETDPAANPRMVARLEESGCHKMYAAAVAGDGTVYMGGRWFRNGIHGGLGWWNPKTNESGGMWKDISNYQVFYLATVNSGNTIVLSTARCDDQVLGKPKPKQGALHFFDHTSKRITSSLDILPDIKGTGPIVAVGAHRIIGWTSNPKDDTNSTSILWGVDTATRTVDFTKIIPSSAPAAIASNQMENWDFRLGPDGQIWTFMGQGPYLTTICKINPANANVTVIGKLDKGGRMAFTGKQLFLSGDDWLRRVDNVVP